MATTLQEADAILLPWAAKHGLHISTMHRDEVVRSFEIVSTNGEQQCQVWLSGPDAEGVMSVEVWRKATGLRESIATTAEGLETALDAALTKARDWVRHA